MHAVDGARAPQRVGVEGASDPTRRAALGGVLVAAADIVFAHRFAGGQFVGFDFGQVYQQSGIKHRDPPADKRRVHYL